MRLSEFQVLTLELCTLGNIGKVYPQFLLPGNLGDDKYSCIMGLWKTRGGNTQHSLPSVNVSCVDDKDDNVVIEGGSQLTQGQISLCPCSRGRSRIRVPCARSSVAILEGFVWPRVWQGQSWARVVQQICDDDPLICLLSCGWLLLWKASYNQNLETHPPNNALIAFSAI